MLAVNLLSNCACHPSVNILNLLHLVLTKALSTLGNFSIIFLPLLTLFQVPLTSVSMRKKNYKNCLGQDSPLPYGHSAVYFEHRHQRPDFHRRLCTPQRQYIWNQLTEFQKSNQQIKLKIERRHQMHKCNNTMIMFICKHVKTSIRDKTLGTCTFIYNTKLSILGAWVSSANMVNASFAYISLFRHFLKRRLTSYCCHLEITEKIMCLEILHYK